MQNNPSNLDHVFGLSQPSSKRARKKRPTIAMRMRAELKTALAERNPDSADRLSDNFCFKYFGKWVAGTDMYSAIECHNGYSSLSSLRATSLFWSVYQQAAASTAYPWARQASPAEFTQLSKAELLDVWRARQCADALGMPYEDYIYAVFGAYNAGGRISRPSPKDLGSSFAIATAAFRRSQIEAVHAI